MSTSDRQEQGPLTRKQLREIRLTGSTPVITAEEAAAAAAVVPDAQSATPGRDDTNAEERAESAATSNAASHDATTPAAPAAPASGAGASTGGLTRRQVRELERQRAGTATPADTDGADDADAAQLPAPVSAATASSSGAQEHAVYEDVRDDEVIGADDSAAQDSAAQAPDEDPAASVAELGLAEDDDAEASESEDVLADVDDADAADISVEENPTVNPAFGQDLLSDPNEARAPFAPSFDELLTVGDSTGSQHLAPNTLIFTPSAGDGDLSGPVASTGEILITGSYELPRGLGSQGHAHGTTDGKDIDAVLIDGELPPASSPTPIAASAAVSTIKPAGEVIRPPAPEKGNKLMLILAIVAGGLALALGVSLIIAFTTNVF